MLESEAFDNRLDDKLSKLGETEAFAPMVAMGMDAGQLKPMIKPFIGELGQDLAPFLKVNSATARSVLACCIIVRM